MENQVEVQAAQTEAPAEIKFTKDGFAALIAIVAAQAARIDALESKNQTSSSQREMTEDDARSVLFGETAGLKHKAAAEKLGLSYGQVYSCRLQHTFKQIHAEAKQIVGFKNVWVK